MSRATSKPTTTTTTTTTTTSATVVEQAADERQQTPWQPETIDSRMSTSSRSRQRSNRTRGERLRFPQIAGTVSTAVKADATGMESMGTRLRPSSSPPFGMKTSWRSNVNGQHPDEAFQLMSEKE